MPRGARLGRGRPNRPIILSNAAVQARGSGTVIVVTPARSRRIRALCKALILRNAAVQPRPPAPLVSTPLRSIPRRGQVTILRAPLAPVTPPADFVRPHVLVSKNISSSRKVRPARAIVLRNHLAESIVPTQDFNWTFWEPAMKWNFEALTVRISSLNRSKVQASVRVDSDGLPYSPTGATPEMAFLADPLAKPSSGDWKACNWDVTRVGTYVMQCLVGPGGTVNLAVGGYYWWVRVTDATSGEQPVKQLARLYVD